MLLLDSVKIKWLEFSNPETIRISKEKALTGVTKVELNHAGPSQSTSKAVSLPDPPPSQPS